MRSQVFQPIHSPANDKRLLQARLNITWLYSAFHPKDGHGLYKRKLSAGPSEQFLRFIQHLSFSLRVFLRKLLLNMLEENLINCIRCFFSELPFAYSSDGRFVWLMHQSRSHLEWYSRRMCRDGLRGVKRLTAIAALVLTHPIMQFKRIGDIISMFTGTPRRRTPFYIYTISTFFIL